MQCTCFLHIVAFFHWWHRKGKKWHRHQCEVIHKATQRTGVNLLSLRVRFTFTFPSLSPNLGFISACSLSLWTLLRIYSNFKKEQEQGEGELEEKGGRSNILKSCWRKLQVSGRLPWICLLSCLPESSGVGTVSVGTPWGWGWEWLHVSSTAFWSQIAQIPLAVAATFFSLCAPIAGCWF